MTTIALIDNHPIIRTGLGLIIKNNFDEVTLLESQNVSSLQNSYPAQMPNLIILGLNQSSNVNKLTLITQANNWFPNARIIMYDEMSSFDPSYGGESLSNSSLILGYLRAGVAGYLNKQNDLTDLLDCIRDVIKGKRYISSEAFEILLNKQLVEKNTYHRASNLLTSREYEIAGYLSDGMKTSMIAQKLDRKASTISTTKNNIFKKLEVDNILKLRQVLVPDQTILHM